MQERQKCCAYNSNRSDVKIHQSVVFLSQSPQGVILSCIIDENCYALTRVDHNTEVQQIELGVVKNKLTIQLSIFGFHILGSFHDLIVVRDIQLDDFELRRDTKLPQLSDGILGGLYLPARQ